VVYLQVCIGTGYYWQIKAFTAKGKFLLPIDHKPTALNASNINKKATGHYIRINETGSCSKQINGYADVINFAVVLKNKLG
jgi:hypothetical protein